MTLDKPTELAGPAGTSPIEFRLDPASGVPTYLQLVRQVEDALLLGYLRPGDQLPKVRDVVADLAINPNTVLKAYRELEYKGLASGRPGQGTFVEAGVVSATLPQLASLRRRLVRWLGEAETAGLDASSTAALVTATLRDFTERRRASDAAGEQEASQQAGGGVA
jgi:GntR family transcriptional regulator